MSKLASLILNLNIAIVKKRIPLKNLEPILTNFYQNHDKNEIYVYETILKNSLKRQQDYNKGVLYVNKYFELNLLHWGKIAKTDVHNHPENGCISLILKGALVEHFYNPYYFDALNDPNLTEEEMKIVLLPDEKTYLHPGDCNYIDDTIGFHKIQNCGPGYSSDGNTLSLHIYSPPNFYCPDNIIEMNPVEGRILSDNNCNVFPDYLVPG